jgi:hypothetical protein
MAGMGQGSLRAALGHPGIEIGQGGLVQRDGALRAQLAQRDLDPCAVAAKVPQAVELEVQQFA